MRISHAAVALLALFLPSTPLAANETEIPQPLEVSICELVTANDPTYYDGQTASITASAKAGMHYEIALVDSDCDRAIHLLVPESISKHPTVSCFRSLAFSGFPFDLQPVPGTFVGTLNYHSQSIPRWTLLLREPPAIEETCP